MGSGSRGWIRDSYDLRVEESIRADGQMPYRGWQIKAARAAGAGIHEENAPMPFDKRPMSVAEQNSREPCCRRIQAHCRAVMQKIQVVSFKEEHIGFWQLAARASAINIAANSVYRCDLSQGFENGSIADVAQMQNALDTGEEGQNLRTEQAVGVAEDTPLHRLKLSSCVSRMSGLRFGASHGRAKGSRT